ncbi:MAG TPA: hypothetical protein VKZ53_19730 [Candidatus Angelobacter sp.]|nr:hypothetical protein [Candidatus Angelobacter sp.]
MNSLRPLLYATFLFVLTAHVAHAGDDASGRTPYSLNLALPFTTSSMEAKDTLWSESLVRLAMKLAQLWKSGHLWPRQAHPNKFRLGAQMRTSVLICAPRHLLSEIEEVSKK